MREKNVMSGVFGVAVLLVGAAAAPAGDCRSVIRLADTAGCERGYAIQRVVTPQYVSVQRFETPVYFRTVRQPVVFRQRERVVVERVRQPVFVRERFVDTGNRQTIQRGLINISR